MIENLKPYPAMRDSGVPWLGDAPEHWKQQRMKTLLRERSEKGFPQEPLLAATQTKGVVRKEQFESRTVLALKDLHLLKLVRVGDFVISLRSFQGGIEYAHEQGIISPAYTVLYPYDKYMQGYFSWLFKSKPFIHSLSLFVTGIRQGQNIDYEKLSRSILPVPATSEQGVIVNFLDRADRLIRRYIHAKRKLIALLQEQKQRIIHRAVTRGVDPNVRLKSSGVEWLSDVPEHWDIFRVKQCASVISKGTTPSTEEEAVLESGSVRFLKAENIAGEKIVDKPMCFIDEQTNQILRRSQLQGGDVLFVIAGATIGKIALIEENLLPANTNQAVAFLRPNDRVIPEYLAVCLQSPRIKELMWLNAVQSAQPNLSLKDLGNFWISLPSCREQGAILVWLQDVLGKLDTLLECARREIALLREYRVKLIADVITGKTDVREATAYIPGMTLEPKTFGEDEQVDDNDEISIDMDEAELAEFVA